jgi:Ras family protein T1
MTDAVIPSQTTSNDVCVTVMDSSARPGDSEVLKQKMLAADSIVALYDVTRPDTFESLIQVWFPLIKEVYGENHSKPVVVVGTKTDLLMEDPDTDRLREMLEMFPFVLVCLRCSALQLLDVEDIFQYGVDAVTYPLEPIFDIFTHEFKPACRRAFLRIFRALDLDNDNLLSDSEMRDTELKCFSLQISDEELIAMKRQIAQGVEGGLRNEMVTFEGFLGLVKMIVEETSLRIPWQILRRFDYDDDLDFMVRSQCVDI